MKGEREVDIEREREREREGRGDVWDGRWKLKKKRHGLHPLN